ncbi:MAG: NAD(P)H-hydrate epimerase [Planctomycetes bacterium]|nr:NAD(P)H-hydrate epimerase [Planctomycetota bacterium]
MQPISFDRRAARAYDRMCMERLGIPGIVLMENAARGCADIALRMLGTAGSRSRVAVLCGPGQNGGDGYAITRHLANAQCAVDLFVHGEPAADSDANVNACIAAAMNIPRQPLTPKSHLGGYALLVDALWGTGLDRPLAPADQALIEIVNSAGRPVLSVDLPSGMDADTGEPLPVCVGATITVTMVAPKKGFANPGASRLIGRLEIVSIGGPAPGAAVGG